MEQKRLNRKALFETLPVWQAILKLALPSVAGQIILVIYNMADAFFVGLTGSDEKIAAVTLCMPAFLVLSALANLFGVGGASMIARALGDGRHSLARHTAAFSLAGCAACSVLYGLLVWLLGGSFIRLLGGADPAVLGLAQDYLFYTVVLGGAATALNTLFSHLLRAEGRSLQASLGIALGGVLNIGLDPLLMFRLLPAGQETRGAAIATMLSNLISLLYYGAVLFLGRKHSDLSFRPCRAMLEDDIPRGVLSAGLPACLMTLLENLSFAVLEHLMSLQGTAVQAGVGVAKKVNMLAHCIVRGMAQGLGIPQRVTSPTFTIVNEYEGGRLPLFHFDMYRLRDADDLFDIGWEDFLRRGGICAVEWSENIRDALDEDTLWVDIRRGVTDGQRIITLHGPGLDGWDPDKPEPPEGRTP